MSEEVALPAREQLIEDAAQALHDKAVPGCELTRGTCPVLRHYRLEAATVLSVVESAAGSEVREEWGVRCCIDNVQRRVNETLARRDVAALLAVAHKAEIVSRTVSTSSWREVK